MRVGNFDSKEMEQMLKRNSEEMMAKLKAQID